MKTSSRLSWKGYLALAVVNLVAFGVIGLGAFLWLKHRDTPEASHIEGTIVDGFFEPADDVGYIHRPNQKVTARRMTATRTIYDVVYTIGPDRFRIMPPPTPGAKTACVPTFVDSFTFGDGVNDDQTYSWLLASRNAGKYQVYNFGVGGWGPHQMLAGLQSGRFQRALSCAPTDAILVLISGHMRRVAGRDSWGGHGPYFRLQPDGSVVRDGYFDTTPRPAPVSLDQGFLRWRRLFGVYWTGTQEDVDLTAAVIAASRKELLKFAPASRLHVIYWDTYSDRRTEDLLEKIAASGVIVHRPEQIAPDFLKDETKYILHPSDRHPTAEAHRVVADYIAREILEKGKK